MNKIRKALIFLLVFLTLAMQALSAGALPPMDPNAACTMHIQYANEGTAISGANFQIYRVASRSDYGDFTFLEPFSQYPLDLKEMDQSKWTTLAVTLQGLVNLNSVKPTYTGTTDDKGELTIPNAPCGLYLITAAKRNLGDYTYSCAPFVVALPGVDTEKDTWQNTVTIHPKSTKNLTPPDERTVTRKVLKVWDDTGYTSKRPKSVTVRLYCDGKLYEQVTLNEANNWRYTWSDLLEKYEWTLSEDAVSGYTTKVTKDGITFVVTNTYTPPYTPPSNPPGNPPTTTTTTTTTQLPHTSLPQTGQLWWPIVPLAVVGLFLIVMGLLRRRGELE